MKPTIKIKLKRNLSRQLDDLGLKCDRLVIPYYEKMITSLCFLEESQFFTAKEFKKYLKDLTDRMFTHFSVWNPDLKIKFKY
jgi:hypothetical protein